jgi:hypothetical protein
MTRKRQELFGISRKFCLSFHFSETGRIFFDFVHGGFAHSRKTSESGKRSGPFVSSRTPPTGLREGRHKPGAGVFGKLTRR